MANGKIDLSKEVVEAAMESLFPDRRGDWYIGPNDAEVRRDGDDIVAVECDDDGNDVVVARVRLVAVPV